MTRLYLLLRSYAANTDRRFMRVRARNTTVIARVMVLALWRFLRGRAKNTRGAPRFATAICATALFIALITAMSGCSDVGSAAREKTPYSPEQIAEIILSTQPNSPELSGLTPQFEDFAIRVSSAYEIDPDGLSDGVICSPEGFWANEIAILRLNGADGAENAVAALETYKESRVNTYAGYAPDQSALAQRGEICSRGEYVALLICDEEDKAAEAFFSCFEDTPPSLPESQRLLSWQGYADPNDDDSGNREQDTESAGTSASDSEVESADSPGLSTGAASTSTSSTATSAWASTGTSEAASTTTSATTSTEVASTGTSEAASTTTPSQQPATLEDAYSSNAEGSSSAAQNAADSIDDAQNAAISSVSQDAEATSVDTQDSPDSTGEPDDAPPAEPDPTSSHDSAADDVFDPAAVLDAWRAGDLSTLSGKNSDAAQILAEAVGELIHDGMTLYEKELAIHDWIIGHADYDWAADSQNPNDKPSPDSDNAYGLLVDKKAICSGYSSTFQLFMDMIGIECMTVEGKANAAREDHAWNLVRLEDGEWYCVDVTWDDPFGSIFSSVSTSHRFFNVTSDYLRDNVHFWDEEAVPECEATLYAWNPE